MALMASNVTDQRRYPPSLITEESVHPYLKIIQALQQNGRKVVVDRGNKRHAMAQCPSHRDGNPSLSISVGSDDRVLMKCFAGCDNRDIIETLGLHMSDMFVREHEPREIQKPRVHEQQSQPSAVESLPTHTYEERGNTVYQYVDADGVVAYEVLRIPKEDGTKTFRQRHTDANGSTVYNLNGITPLPFGLPEILSQQGMVIHVTEGEKDTIRLRECGQLSTSIPDGAVNVSETSEYFRGRDVVIHQDNDEPGKVKATKRAELLLPVAASVKVVEYPELPHNGDVTDFLQSHSIADLLARVDATPCIGRDEEQGDTTSPAAMVWGGDVLPLDRPYGPQFPAELLPEPLAKLVAAVASSTQTPLDMSVTTMLGVLSAAVNGKYIVRMGGWDEPVHGYFLVAADPGSRKSQVVSVLSQPINEWESERNKAEAAAVAEWHSKHRVLKSSLSRAESPSKGKLGDSALAVRADRETALGELLEHEANPVVSTVIRLDDSTTEAMAAELFRQGGAVSLIAPEAKIIENANGMYKGASDFDLLLRGHAGEAYRVDRKMSEGGAVDRACLTLCLMTQPEYIRGLGENRAVSGRGLSQRFLMAFPRSTVGYRATGRRVPQMESGLQDLWSYRIKELLSQRRSDTSGTRFTTSSPDVLTLTESAYDYLDAFSSWHEQGLRGVKGDYLGWCGKQVGAAVRIAGLLHLYQFDPQQGISGATMLQGILISQWFRDHAEVMYRILGQQQSQSAAAELLEWLQSCETEVVKRSDIWAALRKRSRWGNPKQLDDALEMLELHRAVIIEERKTSGRPTKNVYINPAIHSTENANAMDDDMDSTLFSLSEYLRTTVESMTRDEWDDDVPADDLDFLDDDFSVEDDEE